MLFVCFRCFAGILLNVVGLFLLRHLISVSISSSVVSGNEKFSFTIIFSFILLMLGWPWNSITAFKIGSSAIESEIFILEPFDL